MAINLVIPFRLTTFCFSYSFYRLTHDVDISISIPSGVPTRYIADATGTVAASATAIAWPLVLLPPFFDVPDTSATSELQDGVSKAKNEELKFIRAKPNSSFDRQWNDSGSDFGPSIPEINVFGMSIY